MARSASIVGLLLGWLLLGLSTSAEAGLFFKAAANQPPAAAVIPAPVELAPVSSNCSSCFKPCISYRHRGRPISKCCTPYASQTLCVCVPENCCKVEIPVCLPACCTGCPEVSGRAALFGDGVVTYKWCCGVKVTVRFTRCGEALVTYWGA